MVKFFKPRYIDGRRLWKTFDQAGFFVDREDRDIAQQATKEAMADGIEIVKCKNCKYGENNYLQEGLILCTYYSSNGTCDDILMTEDDYCSHGENRYEETTELE